MTTWGIISGPGSAGWNNSSYDYKNLWGDWSSFTWGTIQSAGYSWSYLAGDTFSDTASSPTTTWVVTP